MMEVPYLLMFSILSYIPVSVDSAPSAANDSSSRFLQEFSQNVIFNLDQLTHHLKGVSTVSILDVGHMLAHIHSKVWNDSDVGIERVLNIPIDNISSQLKNLQDKFHKAQISSANFLFTNDRKSSVVLTKESRDLSTELIYTDFTNDWNASWSLMNGLLANNTEGTLDKQLVPFSRIFLPTFDKNVVGVYMSTSYYKGNWLTPWKYVGDKEMASVARETGKYSVPFYEVDGPQLILENDDITAAAIPLTDKNKYVVFVLPKDANDNIIKADFIHRLRNKMDISKWQLSKSRKVQIPKLSLINQMSFSGLFEKFGMNNTFCSPSVHSGVVSSPIKPFYEKQNYVTSPPFLANPMVQSTRIHISEEFIELSSGTAMSISSLEKGKKRKMAKELNNVRPVQLSKNKETTLWSTVTTEKSSATASKPKAEDVLVFDSPFLWYLYDVEVGLLYGGAVIDLGLFDFTKKLYSGVFGEIYKAELFRC